ncbi:MAG: glutamine-synthetase adenylyltransferase [Bryobacteraceae bacterium]
MDWAAAVSQIGFRDSEAARANLARLEGRLSPGVVAALPTLLAESPDPDSALNLLERLTGAPESYEPVRRLDRSRFLIHYAIAIFGYSQWLGETLIQNTDLLQNLGRDRTLDRSHSREDFLEHFARFRSRSFETDISLLLARFKKREYIRIMLRDVLGIAPLAETTAEISALSDVLIEEALRSVDSALRNRYATPRHIDHEGRVVDTPLAVLSMGKLGGNELNYSSDVDLLFLYGDGEPDPPGEITNREYFIRLAQQVTEVLARVSREGPVFRIDLRLRPQGAEGEPAVPLGHAIRYYANVAHDWELQALIKVRHSAGDLNLARDFIRAVQPFVYREELNFAAIETAVNSLEKIGAHRRKRLAGVRRSDGIDVKLDHGGIRDIEFLVQCLQRLHGGRETWVRHGGTMLALSRLRDKDLLSPTEYSRLASAYQFLRELEHRLQFYGDRQIHTLPTEAEVLSLLAREMPASQIGSAPSADLLLRELNKHLEEVQEIYGRVIHAQQPMYYAPAPVPVEPGPAGDEQDLPPEPASNLVRFLDQRAPRLAVTLSRDNLRRGRAHFEHFLERMLPHPDWMSWMDADSVLAGYILDLFEHSPYFSEQLIRNPELIVELRHMREKPGPDLPYQDMISSLEDAGDLRKFFRREMFRVQCESICLETPIFATLERTSDLADAVIMAAYRMAVAQVAAQHPPSAPGYQPANQMVVVTMGRLGMREFDLASDADIVFVIPDRDAAGPAFWTRVAERLISIVSAYTGDGVMFAVDTRLRPNGREGAMVQPEAAYKDYFANHAQAWEGITYMKTRAVAGDIERGTRFLNELQDVDWRRYGQSGRSRQQLVQMRHRLEKEQGGGNRLKAGQGGYYDIDFALMYLRLKGAGIFYKVLNTPARIDVIEQMGHIDRSDADFLRDAAIFYRALDHGLRVLTGHSEGDLPEAGSQLEILSALVRRWTPEHLHDQPLHEELAQIQARTREFFDRLFVPPGHA